MPLPKRDTEPTSAAGNTNFFMILFLLHASWIIHAASDNSEQSLLQERGHVLIDALAPFSSGHGIEV